MITLHAHNILIFIVSDFMSPKSLISSERTRTIKSGIRRNSKLKQTKIKINEYQIHKMNKLQTKKQCKCSLYSYHATYWTKRFRDKAYIKTDTLSKRSVTLKNSPQWQTENILYPNDNNVSLVFLKTVYFPHETCEMMVQAHM